MLNSVLLFGQVEVINNPEKGLWQDREEVPISFELVQTYGAEFPDLGAAFSTSNKIFGVQTDNAGNVYVLDTMIPLLVKFSPSGEEIWKWDQRGRGPGDLDSPFSIAVTDSLVFVSNLNGSRIDVLSKSGVFIKTKNSAGISKQPLLLVGIIENKFLVIRNTILGEVGVQITILDIEDDLEIYSQFKALDKTELDIPASYHIPNLVSIVEDQTVIAGVMSYEIRYYDKEGDLKKRVNRKFPDFFRIGFYDGGQRGYAVSLGSLTSFYEIADNYLVNYVIWPSNLDDPDQAAEDMFNGKFPDLKQESSLDLFNKRGELLYSIKSKSARPDIGSIKHSDSEGFLYTTTNTPYPQIRKYKIVIEE